MKPKSNSKSGLRDNCQTPPYALEPLLPYLKSSFIWECASGKGVLLRELRKHFLVVVGTDISEGKDFLKFKDWAYDFEMQDFIIVTNPPYSIKYKWLEKCYRIGLPFALLLPVETIGSSKAQKMFSEYGMEIILMSPRVDFYMPNKGHEGTGAQFPTAWFTWGLNLPQQINFATLNKPKRSELAEYWKEAFGDDRDSTDSNQGTTLQDATSMSPSPLEGASRAR